MWVLRFWSWVDGVRPAWAIGLGCGLGGLAWLLPGTSMGAGVGLLGVGGLLWLGLSGRALLVEEPREVVPPRPDHPPAAVPLAKRSPEPFSSRKFAVNGVDVSLTLLPGGAFLMGSRDDDAQAFDDERPRRRVTLSPFWMMPVSVTQRLYRAVLDEGTWADLSPEQADLPVTEVSWFDAVHFCNALSVRCGLRPCYTQTESGWTWDRSADGFRLPTEAEREYAARSGSAGAYCYGDDPEQLGEYAWFRENAEGQVHPVGQRRRSAWGLYDLHGNIWEWCWDRYGPYTWNEAADPKGPATGEHRVLRGGAYWDEPRLLRSSFRDWYPPGGRVRNFGFRCVCAGSLQP